MPKIRNVFAGAAIVLAVVLAAGAVPGGAQTPAPYVHVFVDGQPVGFDVPPQIQNGRVLVPLRGVFERLGATVAWDDRTQTVLAQRGATGVSLVIGQTQAMINGRPAAMDVPAMLVGGRTMVPLRFVSQALGATVNWDASTSTVTIASSGAATVPPSQTYTPGPTVQHVVGTIVAVRLPVDPGSPGAVVVSHDGTVSTYRVTSSTVITRVSTTTGAGGSVAIGALRAGDTVDILVTPDNVARRIRATHAF
ncbi:MAG TPA: copper amine oxidase N-terminal domain-containing protein [bacterium]|nr:copper amine oxidase N-terminal domain-containing protein [bacterium]